MNTILTIFTGYIALFIAIIVGVNWITKGFLMKFLSVKGSRGKKVLVRCKSKTDVYFVTGAFSPNEERQGAFVFQNREKVQKLLTNVTKNDLKLSLGVHWLEYDDDKDCLIREGIDPKTGEMFIYNYPATSPDLADKFVDRAAKLPRKGGKATIVIIVLLVMILLASGIAAYYGYKAYTGEQILLDAMNKVYEKVASTI